MATPATSQINHTTQKIFPILFIQANHYIANPSPLARAPHRATEP